MATKYAASKTNRAKNKLCIFLRIGRLLIHYHLAPLGLVTMDFIIEKFTSCVKI